MDYLKEKTRQLEQALNKWQAALEAAFTDLNRDAAIQRFEFSFELLWKSIKLYLKEIEKIGCHSPRSCFREIKPIFNLSEDEVETCLKMADDRNYSVHTYSEKMADALYQRLDGYWKLAHKIKLLMGNNID
ncbi:nucleotidyltransferase substrate binding protein [bacterium]|nr:nucleotidyltransferase substrate binding protein [bacterium]